VGEVESQRGLDAVIFDWGGTITPWHHIDHIALWHAYTDLYDPENADELAHRLAAAEDVRWGAQRDTAGAAGTGTMEFVFNDVSIDTSTDLHKQAFDAYLSAWDPHTFTRPEAADVFQAIRDRGLKVGILSNTTWPRTHHEKVFARDGVLHLIDGAVYTSETATAKPHRDAFHEALAAVGAGDPSRVVFVGDRPWDDIHGAQQVGMRAVLVPHSDIPEHQQVDVGEVIPDATVHDLNELISVIDAWL
jgi:putative hydrolase of the HAD superfamily